MRTLLATIVVIVLVVIIVAGFISVINRDHTNNPLSLNNVATSTGSTASTTALSTSTSSTSVTRLTPNAPATGGSQATPTTRPTSTARPTTTARPTATPRPTASPTFMPSQTTPPVNTQTPAPAPTQSTPQNRYNFMTVTSGNSGTAIVDPGAKNVAALSFNVGNQTGLDGVITQFIMGSDNGNAFYNYLENFRVIRSDGAFIGTLNYTNQLMDWHPVFRLGSAMNVPMGTNQSFTVIADLKPGVSGVTVPALRIFGASGDTMISAGATGNTIIVR